MKGKIIIGLLAICVLAGSGWLLYSHHGQHIAAAVQQQAASISHPDVAFVGEDFTLPAVDNDLPVYDRYTVQQRKDKGLPLTYGTTRDYYYGDHVAYLTFDDGPNKENTTKILKILKDEQIHATFFLTGNNVERYPDVVKAIYESGNAIGIHSYSHDYKKIYASPQAYMDEVDKTAGLIYDVIHVRPVISRAPGGTSGHFTKAFWQALNQEGYIEVGWNSLTGDADGTGKTAGKEVENIKKQLALRPYLHSHLVILMHDASGHQATVEALPELIKLLKSQGYTFRVVTTAIPPSW
ncbi:polysaccharide deacetylase family protein [uncultured Megasphaera sp.]|uniref:polysaccharide deacetylase family protein n=1 Tax=uncultured Megasphaera sp. TaxID=165188 RepID=UPI0025F67868|nr:polysaccharide deacetylase family protein [uncultured Megasphaera sp.]